jgi:putative transposase
MRKSKFTESQIVAILAEGESGLAVGDVCRKHGISNATDYQWKSKYAGVSANELKRIKDLEPRTASSSACMPSLLWRIRRSGMFYRESCSAGSKESGGHGDGSGPSNLQGQSLQDRGLLAVGVLQIHSGLGG